MKHSHMVIASRATIACHIDGIRIGNTLSIPLDSADRIERSVTVVRRLLDVFGGYTVDEVPEFSNDKMVLSFAHKNGDQRPCFDAVLFDRFARAVAERFDAARENRHELQLHEFPHHSIEEISESLTGFGTVTIEVSGMPPIVLACRNSRRSHADRRVMIEVDKVSEVARIDLTRGALLADEGMASKFHRGDVLSLDKIETEQVRRAVGVCIEVIDDSIPAEGDLFEPDQDISPG